MFKWFEKRNKTKGRKASVWPRRGEDRAMRRRMVLAARKLQQAQLALGTDVAQLQELRGLLTDSDGRFERLENELSLAKGAVSGLGERLDKHAVTLREAVESAGGDALFAQSEARLEELVGGLRELLSEHKAGPSEDLTRLLSEREERIEELEAAQAALEGQLASSNEAGDPEDLQAELEAREERVEELEGVRANLESSLDGLRLTLETYELEFRERELGAAFDGSPGSGGSGLDPRVPELRDELAQREQRIAALQANLARLEGAVRSLEITIEVQDQELSEVGLGVGEGEPAAQLHADYAHERERAGELEVAIDELRSDLKHQESELRKAEAKRDEVERLRGELDNGRERLDELCTRNAELEGSITGLRQALETHDAEGGGDGELLEELERHRARVATLEEQSVVNESALRDSERERIELETRHMQDMIQVADQGHERIVKLKEELETRDKAVVKLERQLLDIQVDVAESASNLAQLMRPLDSEDNEDPLGSSSLEMSEGAEPTVQPEPGALPEDSEDSAD